MSSEAIDDNQVVATASASSKRKCLRQFVVYLPGLLATTLLSVFATMCQDAVVVPPDIKEVAFHLQQMHGHPLTASLAEIFAGVFFFIGGIGLCSLFFEGFNYFMVSLAMAATTLAVPLWTLSLLCQ